MKFTGKAKEIIKELLEVDSDIVFDATVEPHKEKKSLNANGYYWKLLGDLSRTINIPAHELYRFHIKELSNYQCMLMVTEAVAHAPREPTMAVSA